MAWIDDKYIRNLLDGRERWGTLLSVTAVAAFPLFLAEHPHRSWVNLGPLAVGLFGTFFVLVVDCYYEQAEAFANAREKSGENALAQVKSNKWYSYISSIGILGWLHILAPIILGALATLVLYFGFEPSPPAAQNTKNVERITRSCTCPGSRCGFSTTFPSFTVVCLSTLPRVGSPAR